MWTDNISVYFTAVHSSILQEHLSLKLQFMHYYSAKNVGTQLVGQFCWKIQKQVTYFDRKLFLADRRNTNHYRYYEFFRHHQDANGVISIIFQYKKRYVSIIRAHKFFKLNDNPPLQSELIEKSVKIRRATPSFISSTEFNCFDDTSNSTAFQNQTFKTLTVLQFCQFF